MKIEITRDSLARLLQRGRRQCYIYIPHKGRERRLYEIGSRWVSFFLKNRNVAGELWPYEEKTFPLTGLNRRDG